MTTSEITPSQAPGFLTDEQAHFWAMGWNACLESSDLIEAAPDLLSALKEIRLIASDLPIFRNDRFAEASRKAFAAIAKAERRA